MAGAATHHWLVILSPFGIVLILIREMQYYSGKSRYSLTTSLEISFHRLSYKQNSSFCRTVSPQLMTPIDVATSTGIRKILKILLFQNFTFYHTIKLTFWYKF